MNICMYTIIIQKHDILHIHTNYDQYSGMNVVGVQYLVIMKLGVAIYNYMISDWNCIVSMQFEVAALCRVKGITLNTSLM